MTPEEKSQLEELMNFKRDLESFFTIPVNIQQSFKRRFSLPTIVQVTLDFANTASQAGTSMTVQVPGAAVGDVVVVTPPAAAIVGNLGGIFTAYVSSSGVVTIRFFNPDASSALNPGSGLFTLALFKK